MNNQNLSRIRKEHSLNKPELDGQFDNNGERVFFNKNGEPYVLKSNGNRNYNFNGKWTWKNISTSEGYRKGYVYDLLREVGGSNLTEVNPLNNSMYDTFQTKSGERVYFDRHKKPFTVKSGELDYSNPAISSNFKALAKYYQPVRTAKTKQTGSVSSNGRVEDNGPWKWSPLNTDNTPVAEDPFKTDDYLSKRVQSTIAMLDDFGGYESYQMASETLSEVEFNKIFSTSPDEVKANMKKRFTATYDRWGNKMYAALSDNLEDHFVTIDGYDEPIKSLTASELFDPNTPLTDAQRDRFVLTSFGENRAIEVNYKNAQVTQHKKVMRALVSDLQEVKKTVDDTNKITKIKMSETVRTQLGLAAEVVTPSELRNKLKSYLATQMDAGVSGVFMSDADAGKGRTVDKILSYGFQALRDTTGAHWQRERVQWRDNKSSLLEERKELQREFSNVIADSREGVTPQTRGIANVEQERAYNRDRPESREASMREIIEADNRAQALKEIKVALDNTGHTNEQAKRKILNTVQQSMMTKTPIDVSDNPEMQKVLSDTLVEVNKVRAEKGLPALDKIDYVEEKAGIKVDSEDVQSWRKVQADLEQYNAAYRIKGDKTMYQIADVTDNGTVVAERMSLPASAFRLEMKFAENTDVLNELEVADKKLKVENADNHLTLTETQKQMLTVERATAIKRLNSSGKEITSYIDDAAFTESLIQNNSVMPARNFRVGRGLWDAVLSHAPWMYDAGNAEDLMSNIWMAASQTTKELEGRAINLTSETNMTRGFDEQFEKDFVRNLHRIHFDMSGQDRAQTSAAESLVNDVAKFVRTYVNGETLPGVDPADMNIHVATEVSRLLNDSSDTIGEFNYYKKALDSGFVSATLNAGPAIGNASLDREIGINRFGEGKARSMHEVISVKANETLDDSIASQEANNLNNLLREVNQLEAGDKEYSTSGGKTSRAFGEIKTYFGEDAAADVINSPKSQADGVSRIDVLKNFYQNGLRQKYGVAEADNIIQEIFSQNPTLRNNLFTEVANNITKVEVGSLKDIQSYMELAKVLPGLDMSVKVSQKELAKWAPEYGAGGKFGVPLGESFEFSEGDGGQILARTRGTNLTYEVKDVSNDSFQPERVSISTSKATNQEYISLKPATDMTAVIQPKGKLPVELNTPYDSKKVNSHPTQSNISSSDIGTRQMLKKAQQGQYVTGLDFETTGLPSNQFLQERGLFLPTEAYYQKGRVNKETGEFELGKAKHVFVDIGNMQDSNGNTVRSVVANELGSLTGADLVRETLGRDASWSSLNQADKMKVMNNDKVSFLRNIAKYSNELSDAQRDALVDFKNYAFGDLDSGYSQLVQHATIGLDQLANGTGVQGAKVVNSLGGFVDEYNKSTGRSIILAQNGAQADLAWIKDFSQRSGVAVNDKPKMIEAMQVQRMLHPDDRGSSLGAQINKHGTDEIKDIYNSGSHLADKDTIAMTKLFGEVYLPEVDEGLTKINYAKIGQPVMKVGARGGNKIPIDTYTISDFRETGTGYEMDLASDTVDGDVKTETLKFNSLNEMQQHLSQNYKGFKNQKEAAAYRENLAFDDAREDIIGSQRSFDRMVQNKNRIAGDGVDIGMEKARDLANPYNVQTAEDAALRERVLPKLAQNSQAISDSTWDAHGSGESLSDRQRRAMAASQNYFNSEDANMRQQFLGEVENLRSAGVVADSEVSNLINGFNQKVMDKAAAMGRKLPERTVPGLVDLGAPAGPSWGSMNGKPLTAMANTYGQTKDALWGIANQIQSTLPPEVQQNKALAREQSVNKMIGHLNAQGMNITSGSMDSAVRAVMGRLGEAGSATVPDVTVPLIQGAGDTDMINAFQDAGDEVLAGARKILNERPDLMARYENTKAMRDDFVDNGMAVPKMNYTMAGGMEGPNLPTRGDHAFRHADSLMDDLREATDASTSSSLWKEMYNRAMGDWDDAGAARAHLGWDGSPEEYRTPYQISDNRAGVTYPAGSLMSDIPQSSLEFMRDKWNWAPGVQAQVGAYLNALDTEAIVHAPSLPVEDVLGSPGATEKIPLDTEEADNAAREALRRTSNSVPEYVDETFFNRPQGANMPDSYLDDVISDVSTRTRMAMSDVLSAIPGGGRGVAIAGAIAAAGFAVRQWTRGDVVEGRPEHNMSASPGGGHGGDGSISNLKGGGPAHSGPAPSGGKTYLTDQQSGGYNVQISAKSNGVDSAQVGNALQGAMHGQAASVNIHHQDDRASINSEWLTDKFAQLLDNGSVQ